MDVFTVRMGFYDVDRWTAARIAALYGPELAKLAVVAPQLPAVAYPPVSVQLAPGEWRTLAITPASPFDAVSQTRDTRVPYAQDPAKLAEAGRAALTVFTWNLCGAADRSAALRDLFRRIKPDVGTLKLSPILTRYELAAPDVAGYPAKPASPDCQPKGGGAAAFGVLALIGAVLGYLKFRK